MEERPNDSLDGVTGMWLAEVKGGNSESFGRLYEHIAPALLTWAEFRIRPEQRQHVDPSDVVQEVWFRAWRQMESFDPEATPFRFWIFRIADVWQFFGNDFVLELYRLSFIVKPKGRDENIVRYNIVFCCRDAP